jgi:hypothetical protein
MTASMTIRIAVLLAAAMAWTASTARADNRLFHPSPRALAAAGEEEPPPHEDDPLKVKPQPVKPTVPAEEAAIYKKWWFWALTAAVVGGIVIVGVTTFKPAQHTAMACPSGTVACFGDGHPQ